MAKFLSFLNDYESLLDQFALTRANGESLATDVYEHNGKIIVEAHISGLDPEHVDISIEGNQLFIKGHREEIDEQEDRDYYLKEVRYGYFERIVQLPAEVKLDNATADYENGILTITLQKINGRSRKKIDIKASTSVNNKVSNNKTKVVKKASSKSKNSKKQNSSIKANNNSKTAQKSSIKKESKNGIAKKALSKNNKNHKNVVSKVKLSSESNRVSLKSCARKTEKKA